LENIPEMRFYVPRFHPQNNGRLLFLLVVSYSHRKHSKTKNDSTTLRRKREKIFMKMIKNKKFKNASFEKQENCQFSQVF